MSISISHLSKKYGEQTVLNDINFEIGEGEVVGFLGPNGAGKTTTMKILTGALSYSTGSVKVCGMEVSNNQLKTSSLIGYLPEQNPLYTDMYVKEFLLFVAETYHLGKEKDKRVEELIDKVGLRPEFHKKIGQLSKGYRQRVGLAQALIPNPKVLILDEPTTGLDPNQLEEIRSLIRQIGKDKTVLLSTHIMQEIKAICNRVIVINKAEIVADYPDISKINLFNEENLHFEVEFAEAVKPESLQKLESITAVQPVSEKRFTIIASTDIREIIFDFAVRSNNKILTINSVERSMEDVFRELTK
ncbi:protein involved in gliding motility GldA [Paludibacter propionicigenes WB4]|uniref:Protein involved in gliding motility GldA n=1 Tax=Paludibacter propionicigenes (strain DSM 17365 / JCM 13257 / WB4) TaxID=694427 RepID=E4T5T1_PALPW|nr:ATP-binding cassette domain-containing protein [Paludibacter propionicigenes]ADQ80075.1 protein involved in gliding motility GldA [Paludibacter propionicigenes WB4]